MGDDASDTRLGTGKKLIFSTIFLLVVSGLGLAVTEAVLRVLAPEYEYLVWTPGIHLVFNPEPGAMPGVGQHNRFTTNSLGIRGDELSAGDDYRMLTLGGSTTECLYLDDSEAWPHMLQQRLNEYQSEVKVWVGNIGKSGHSTRDHLLQMELLVPRYPEIDAVILLVGANDLLVHLRSDEGSPSGSPEALGDREQLLLHAFTEFPLRGKSFFERTRIWRGIARLTERMKATRQVAVQDRAGSALTIWRRARRSAPKIGELPDLSAAIEEYKENLRAIADIGQRYGIRTILITQPTMWQSDVPPELDRLLLMGARGGFPIANTYYTVDALTQALRAYNTALWSICSELSLDCVDLTPLLPQDTSVFYDDFHFNESGADKVATALAKQLVRWPPFSKSVVRH
jgi:lysophospholipase L1-like esterase